MRRGVKVQDTTKFELVADASCGRIANAIVRQSDVTKIAKCASILSFSMLYRGWMYLARDLLDDWHMKNLKNMKKLATLSAAALLAAAAHGQTADPIQSTAAPYSLQTAGTVMQAGSDAASQNFDSSVLPEVTQFIQSALPEGQNNTASKAFQVDPSKLVMATSQAVTATFIYEGAAFHNSIGFDAVAPGQSDPLNNWDEVTSSGSKLIFPDASSGSSGYQEADSVPGVRTPSQPLLPGDFENIGTLAQGTKLDFFLLSNGANNYWANVFSTQENLNQDGFTRHAAGFAASLFAVPQLNSPYLFLTFEDSWNGGDQDINDTVIALNVGTATVNRLLATPEPTTAATLAGCLGIALVASRRKRAAAVE